MAGMGVPVKVEPEQDGNEKEGTTSGGHDGGISDNEKKKRHLINLNKRLRKGIWEFRERQEKILEFIEVEHGYSEIQRYQENKKGIMFALGITDEDNVDGQRSQKYNQMLRLIKLGNKYWREQRSRINRPSNTDSRLRYENGVPQELAALRMHVDYDTGLLRRKPVKRCQKCYDDSHVMKFCPYKLAESRTPEVTAMIKARLEKLKREEGADPMISKGYKKKHFKIDEKKEQRIMKKKEQKMKREQRGMTHEQLVHLKKKERKNISRQNL